MEMDVWAEIKNHQYLIVGIIGLGGVIFTLWFNAREARKQRQEERSHDCNALRTALVEELQINREAFERNSRRSEPQEESGGCFVPTDAMDDTYRAFVDRIGLLTQEEVRKVMYAYLSIRTYHSKLFLIGIPPHTGDRHVCVPADNLPHLYGLQKVLLGPVDEAITALKSARDAK